MNKCPNCNEKTLQQVDNNYVCSTCLHVKGNKDKLTNIKRLVKDKEKNAAKKVRDKSIEELQKQRTAEPYARFRVFIVEINNE
jgi:DNA-directed RNA polymerase subunit M/transcription elongation factor TFIIS